jgi:hypothetical protein
VTAGGTEPSAEAPVHLHAFTRPWGSFAVVSFLALASLLAAPSTSWAWGCEGHQVIALIAESHLTPHALATVKQILNAYPIDPALDRFCKQGGTDPLADSSTWSDDIRSSRPETGPWHYIDIPDGAQRRDLAKFCPLPQSCVTQVIRNQLAILKESGNKLENSAQQEAEALRFLIHFVGDLHQPMHAISNNDLGGNCVPVAYFNDLPQLRNPETDSYTPNLHGVWDINLLAKIFPGKNVEQVSAELSSEYHSKIGRWKKAAPDVDGWAWESHQAAIKVAYGKLPVPVPVEAPLPVKSCADDDQVGLRRLKLDEHLDKSYQSASAPLIKQRLAMAGARLAMLLNQLFP